MAEERCSGPRRPGDPLSEAGTEEATTLDPAGAGGSGSLGRQLGQTALANIAIGVVNLATGLALARLLDPDGRGVLAAIINWPMILAAFGTLGLTEACAYYTSKRSRSGREFYLVTILLSTSASLVLAGIGWLLMPVLLASQSADTVTASRWLLLLCPFATIVAVSEGSLRGMRRVPIWNLYRFTWPAAWLVVIVVAIVAGIRSPYVLAAGFAGTRAIAAVPVVIVLLRRLPGPRTSSKATARMLVRYGLPGFFTLLPQIMNSRLDQLLLAGLVDADVLGLYVVSVAWAAIATMPALALAGLVLPRLAAVTSRTERLAQFAHASRLAVVLASGTSLGLLVGTPTLLPLLFGRRFEEAVPTAMILVVAAAFSAWNTVMEDAARGLGSPATVLRAEGTGLVATAVLLVILLDRYSIEGAAIASLLGYGATSVVLLLFGRKQTSYRLGAFLVPRRSDLRDAGLAGILGRLRGRASAPADDGEADRPG